MPPKDIKPSDGGFRGEAKAIAASRGPTHRQTASIATRRPLRASPRAAFFPICRPTFPICRENFPICRQKRKTRATSIFPICRPSLATLYLSAGCKKAQKRASPLTTPPPYRQTTRKEPENVMIFSPSAPFLPHLSQPSSPFVAHMPQDAPHLSAQPSPFVAESFPICRRYLPYLSAKSRATV